MDLGLEPSLLEDTVTSLRSEMLDLVGIRLLMLQVSSIWALAESQSVSASLMPATA